MLPTRYNIALQEARRATDVRNNVRKIMNYLKGEGKKTEPISITCLAYINASKDPESCWYNPEAYTEEELITYVKEIV